jgi:hypothetical protein
MAKKKTSIRTIKLDRIPFRSVDIETKDLVLFQGPAHPANQGIMHLTSFGSVLDNTFGKRVDDVKADFDRIAEQMNQILQGAFSKITGDMKMDSVEISLGFTASGKLAFIAEAGVETSVKVTFKRPSPGT